MWSIYIYHNYVFRLIFTVLFCAFYLSHFLAFLFCLHLDFVVSFSFLFWKLRILLVLVVIGYLTYDLL